MDARDRLLARLQNPAIIPSFAPHDVFTAQVLAAEGIELLFAGGFGTAASRLGVPDLGLLTLSEMAAAVRALCAAVPVPVIADGDTGHGDLPQVVRTVSEFEQAGAAGVLLEDQQFPKRCGHFVGKQVVPADEMCRKLEVALAARRDPRFRIVARTDARSVEGLDAAIQRAKRYADVGADWCFVEAPQSAEELCRIAAEVPRPQLANLLIGGQTPILSLAELESMGFRVAVYPIETLLATGAAVRRLARQLLRDGQLASDRGEMLSFADVKELLGLSAWLAGRDGRRSSQ